MLPVPAPEPLVSIVLPTLNRSPYLARSIESCLSQTYRALELIIVTGGSSDATREIVGGFSDARIKFVCQLDTTDRLPGALNAGFANADGELWSWTQDDDYFALDAVAVMVAALTRQPELDLVYAGFDFVDEHGARLREADLGPPEALRDTNVVGHCFLYRRAIAQRVGPYDPDYYMAEDFHYWLRIYRCGQMARLPGSYYSHRLHTESLTMRGYGRFEALRVAAHARREVLGLAAPDYQRQLAASYIEEAFAAYTQHDFPHVRRCLKAGLWLGPGWLRNRGVLSLAWQSLAGFRRGASRRDLDQPT